MNTFVRQITIALVVAAVMIGCADRAALQTAEEEDVLTDQDVAGAEMPAAIPAPEPLGEAAKALQYAGRQDARSLADDEWPAADNETYNRIVENAFQKTQDHPLSTFSIDVDAASYSNIRRIIREGRVPPIDAVRIEEMVNYFVYDYPEPEGDDPFSIMTEVGPAPWNPAHQLLHVGLQGRRMQRAEQPANNLVFLLDVSGSMNDADKLPLLKQAFGMLLGELGARDRVAIVVYAGAAGLVLPSTPGDEKETILRALDRLEAGGSTAGAAGIQLAYQVAEEHFIEGGNNRVILATDGDFNVGPSSEADLVRMIEAKRDAGTFLTVLGFGRGNLQDARMEQIADHGNGNYYYIDNELEARKVLVTDLRGTLFTIAKDVKIQIEFNPALVASYRLIGYENRLLADEDFNDDTKDAGELGAGHTVTALYELIPVGAPTAAGVPGRDDLRYQNQALTDAAVASGELMTLKLRYKAPDGDASRLLERTVMNPAPDAHATGNNFYFSAAVAEFGMILRASEYLGDATLDQVLALARDAQGDDPYGYRAEFIRLVQDYHVLAGDAVPLSEVR
jgi:Ca-activated chloride channel family protein